MSQGTRNKIVTRYPDTADHFVRFLFVLVKLGRKMRPKSGSGDADPFFATLKRLQKQIRAAADPAFIMMALFFPLFAPQCLHEDCKASKSN